jgi:hypothetical protein
MIYFGISMVVLGSIGIFWIRGRHAVCVVHSADGKPQRLFKVRVTDNSDAPFRHLERLEKGLLVVNR